MALAYHALSRRGTFAASVRALTGVVISDAALSMRKASYGWELLAHLLPRVLRPIADPSADTEAFHGGLRLAAIDGTRFNLRNTPAISAAAVKPKSGKGGAPCAFAPMLCSVLLELAGLHARRWEHELFFRELESHIHGAVGLLQAQTIDGAAHEVMALMLAAALLAGQRRGVAPRAGVPVLRVSPAQVPDRTESLFTVLEAGKDLLTTEQAAELVRRVLEQLAATAIIKPRKPRVCQRAVRQPIKAWPKMRNPTSRKLVLSISITEMNP